MDETETVFTSVRQAGAEAGVPVKQGDPLANPGTDPETSRYRVHGVEKLGSGTKRPVLPWSAGSSCFLGWWNISLRRVDFSPPVSLH